MAIEALSRRRDAKLTLISIPDLQNLFGELSRGEQRSIRLATGLFLSAHTLDHESAGTMGLGKYGLHPRRRHRRRRDSRRTQRTARHHHRAGTEVDPDDLVKDIVFNINQFKESATESLSHQRQFRGLRRRGGQDLHPVPHTGERSTSRSSSSRLSRSAKGRIHHYEVLSRFSGRFS